MGTCFSSRPHLAIHYSNGRGTIVLVPLPSKETLAKGCLMAHKAYHLIKRKDRGGTYHVRYVLDRPFGGTLIRPWQSTGVRDERKAVDWASEQAPKVPPKKKVLADEMPFEAFAKGWWKLGHERVIRQVARGYPLSPAYLEECHRNLVKHILPHFGRAKLSGITGRQIYDWLFVLRRQGLWTCSDFVDTLLCYRQPQRVLFALDRRSVAQVRV
jgi:hypothetical protein